MAYKVHRNKWKGVKWVDTYFSGRRKALASAMCIGVLMHYKGLIDSIRFSPSNTEEEKIMKKIRIAETVIESHKAVKKTYERVMYGVKNA